jgi:hypothetical protein
MHYISHGRLRSFLRLEMVTLKTDSVSVLLEESKRLQLAVPSERGRLFQLLGLSVRGALQNGERWTHNSVQETAKRLRDVDEGRIDGSGRVSNTRGKYSRSGRQYICRFRTAKSRFGSSMQTAHVSSLWLLKHRPLCFRFFANRSLGWP